MSETSEPGPPLPAGSEGPAHVEGDAPPVEGADVIVATSEAGGDPTPTGRAPGGAATSDRAVAATSGDELRTDGSATAIAPTRTSAVWTAAVAVTVLLLLLAIFVGENTQTAHISFLWWHGRAPTAVLVLLAAVCGAAIVIGAAAARILQLRRHGRGQRGTDRRRPPRRDHDVPAEV